MLRRDVKHVMRAFIRDGNVGEKERLRVDRAVDFERADPAELLRVDVLRGQRFFSKRRARAGVVVLRGRDLSAQWSIGEDRGEGQRGNSKADRNRRHRATSSGAGFLSAA